MCIPFVNFQKPNYILLRNLNTILRFIFDSKDFDISKKLKKMSRLSTNHLEIKFLNDLKVFFNPFSEETGKDLPRAVTIFLLLTT